MVTENSRLIKQRWFINILLLIIVGMLGILISLTLDSEQTSVEVPPLTQLQPENVYLIRIERANNDVIELVKKQGERWFMSKPFTLPANTFQVQQILNLLITRNYQDLSTETVPLAGVNLDTPLVKVYMDSLVFAFGAASVFDGEQRYMQLAEKIYLLNDALFPLLTSEPLNFISLSPLGENPKIVALQLPDYQFQLSTDGAWEVTTSLENIDKRPDTVNRLIEDWQTLQAFEVQRYVEKVSEGEIRITLAERKPPLTFQIITQHPDLVLARPAKGVQYLIPIRQADKLLHLPTKDIELTTATY